jgi:hypothetical protein
LVEEDKDSGGKLESRGRVYRFIANGRFSVADLALAISTRRWFWTPFERPNLTPVEPLSPATGDTGGMQILRGRDAVGVYVRLFPASLRGAMVLDVPISGIAGWDEAVADL